MGRCRPDRHTAIALADAVHLGNLRHINKIARRSKPLLHRRQKRLSAPKNLAVIRLRHQIRCFGNRTCAVISRFIHTGSPLNLLVP